MNKIRGQKINVIIVNSGTGSVGSFKKMLPVIKSDYTDTQIGDALNVFVLTELSKLILDPDYRVAQSIAENVPIKNFYKNFAYSNMLYKNLLYREIIRIGVCVEAKSIEEIDNSEQGRAIRLFIDNLVNDIKFIISK